MDDFFLEYLVPVIEDIENTVLIEEWIRNIYADTYEKNLIKDEKLPSIKNKIDCNDKTEYRPKSIMGSLNWLPFIDTIECTADRIENDKNLLPSLLKNDSMFKIKCWWNPR